MTDWKCEICKTLFQVETYTGGSCPKCGQFHEWTEGYAVRLTDDQRELLLRHWEHPYKMNYGR